MPNLIPAAISSQLDQTGEERIHAAPYETVIRPVWSQDLGSTTYAYLTRDVNSATAPYLFVDQLNKNTMTVNTLGSLQLPSGNHQFASLSDNGVDTIFLFGAGSAGRGIRPVYYNGASLVAADQFDIFTGGGFSTYCDAFRGKAVGNTLFVSYQRAMSTSDRRQCVGALTYNPTTHVITETAEEVLFTGTSSAVSGLLSMTLHNEYIVAFANGPKTLYILSYNSGTSDFTVIDTLSLPNAYASYEWNRESISSDGTYIYVGSFTLAPSNKTQYVVSFDGTNLSIVDSFLCPPQVLSSYPYYYESVHPIGDKLVGSGTTADSVIRLLENTSGIVNETAVDEITVTGLFTGAHCTPFFDADYMFLPATLDTNVNGVYQIQGNAFVEVVPELLVGPPGTTPADNPSVAAGTIITDIFA